VIVDPTRICELLVGLGEVNVLGADDETGGPVRVHVESGATEFLPCRHSCAWPRALTWSQVGWSTVWPIANRDSRRS